MNYADEAGLQEMLRQLGTPEHDPTRWGQPHGDQTFRQALADLLRDLGREQEADWVQGGRHLLLTPQGLRPGRFGVATLNQLQRQLAGQLVEAGLLGEEYVEGGDHPSAGGLFDLSPAGSPDAWEVRSGLTGTRNTLRPQDLPGHLADEYGEAIGAMLQQIEDGAVVGIEEVVPPLGDIDGMLDAIRSAPFEEEDVDYARPTDYLAHPGRPDTHRHPASGFNHMGGFSQLNDPNGLQTEILGHGVLWDADVLDPTGSNWTEAMLSLRDMPIDHLYRALLQNGAISRRDVPPPELEDLDLDYAGYAQYADEDDSELDRLGWDPTTPRAASQLGPDGFPLRAPARPGNQGTRPAARLTPSVLPRGKPVFIDGFPVYPGDPRYPAQQARPGPPTPYLPYDLYDSETDPGFEQAPPYAPANDPVYPPGVFPPEPGPPSGFGAGYPPPNSYAALGYDCGPAGAPPARPGMFGEHCPPWAVGPLAAFCGPTEYLAHPGRPDRVGHFRSGFTKTPGGWWELNQGDGPYIAADGNYPSNWANPNADTFNANAFGDIGDYFGGDPPLEASPDFPNPEELYRHMLLGGWFPRVDAPPPALEDLDLDYCSYAQYAELDENFFPIPKKVTRPKIDEFTGFPTAAPISGPPAPSFFPLSGEDTELDRLGWDRTGAGPKPLWRPQRPPTASARYDDAPQYPPPYGPAPPSMGGFGGVPAVPSAAPGMAPQPTMGAPAPMMPPPAPPPDLDVHGAPIPRQYAAGGEDPAVYNAFCAYLDAHPQYADKDTAALYEVFRGVYAEAGQPTSYGFAEDRAGFESAIRANPFEATNHLVAGDFFDDHDLPDEAAFRRAMGDWFGAHEWRDFPSLGWTGGFHKDTPARAAVAVHPDEPRYPWEVRGSYDPTGERPTRARFPEGVKLPDYWFDAPNDPDQNGMILQATGALAHLDLPVNARTWDFAHRLPRHVARFQPRWPEAGWGFRSYPDMEQAFRHSFLHGRRNRPVMASQYADAAEPLPPVGSYIYPGPPEPQEAFA